MCVFSKCAEKEELFKVDFPKMKTLQLKWISVEKLMRISHLYFGYGKVTI